MLRKLGSTTIPAVGLGCMGMSEFYGKADDDASLDTLLEAYRQGYRHFDTADMYGIGHNETLIGKFLNRPEIIRNEIFVSTKGGIVRDPEDKYNVSVNSSSDYIRSACEHSLSRLKTEYIDLYYLHRLNPNTSIEESMGTLKELVEEGKVKHVGLCEASADQIRVAHRILPITAVQSELSLWSRDAEESVIPTCIELDIAFVAFSPLGRGFLSGNIDKDFMNSAHDELDFRKRLPRFNDENLERNLQLVKKLENIARDLGAPVSQVSLSWALHKAPNIHIIPGTKTTKHLKNNFDAQFLRLDSRVMRELDSIFSSNAIYGSRYPQKILEKSTA